MAKWEAQKDAEKVERTPISVGTHILTLTAVNPYERENRNTHRKEPRLAWVFTVDGTTDPKTGKPLEYTEFTGLSYGYNLARLTSLVDWLMPDAPLERKQQGDTDALVGMKVRCRIKEDDNGDGTTRPLAYFMEPMLDFSQLAPTSAPVTDDDKQSLGHLATQIPEGAKAEARKALSVLLGQKGYSSYQDFLARGSRDVADVRNLYGSFAEFNPDGSIPF